MPADGGFTAARRPELCLPSSASANTRAAAAPSSPCPLVPARARARSLLCLAPRPAASLRPRHVDHRPGHPGRLHGHPVVLWQRRGPRRRVREAEAAAGRGLRQRRLAEEPHGPLRRRREGGEWVGRLASSPPVVFKAQTVTDQLQQKKRTGGCGWVRARVSDFRKLRMDRCPFGRRSAAGKKRRRRRPLFGSGPHVCEVNSSGGKGGAAGV